MPDATGEAHSLVSLLQEIADEWSREAAGLPRIDRTPGRTVRLKECQSDTRARVLEECSDKLRLAIGEFIPDSEGVSAIPFHQHSAEGPEGCVRCDLKRDDMGLPPWPFYRRDSQNTLA